MAKPIPWEELEALARAEHARWRGETVRVDFGRVATHRENGDGDAVKDEDGEWLDLDPPVAVAVLLLALSPHHFERRQGEEEDGGEEFLTVNYPAAGPYPSDGGVRNVDMIVGPSYFRNGVVVTPEWMDEAAAGA